MNKFFSVFLLSAVVLLAGSCADPVTNPDDSFNRQEMLTEVANKLIVPSYALTASRAENLQEAVNDFTEAPSHDGLLNCRDAWTDLAEQWQRVVIFDFGPAEGMFGNLSLNVGTFPVDEDMIEQFVALGDTGLVNFDRDTRGLYGTEYLLFHAVSGEVFEEFAGSGGELRGAYLRSIVSRVAADVRAVHEEWTATYGAEFVSRTGTSVGSGTSLLFNNLTIGYELLKNYKVALPLGKMAGQHGPEPSKVEAYHSGQSIKLMRIHYMSVMNLWSGVAADGSEILGFRDYLLTVPNGQRLIDDTEEQHAQVLAVLGLLSDDEIMSDMILTDPSRLERVQIESQKLTRFLKSELSSLIGISITYSSGDGD